MSIESGSSLSAQPQDHRPTVIKTWLSCATRAELEAVVAAEDYSDLDTIVLTWAYDAETNKRIRLLGGHAPLNKEAFSVLYSKRVPSEANPDRTVALGSMASNKLVVVAGVRFRPDLSGLVFEENGYLYVNSWVEPVWPKSRRSVKEFHELVTQVFPDDEARRRFLLALAYKVQHPGARPNAVLSVSPQDGAGAGIQGTGRGALFNLLSKLCPGYVAFVDYKTLTGQTHQSQYGEWRERALFVCVDEIKDTSAEHIYRRSASVAVGEQLKVLTERWDNTRMHMRKGVANVVEGRDFFWLLMASNHVDAVTLDAQDRRIEPSQSGRKRDDRFWSRVKKAIDDPMFLAAVWHFLKSFDTSDYVVGENAPLTEFKKTLLAATRSPIDELATRVVEELREHGRYAEGPDFKRLARLIALEEDEESITPQIATVAKRQCRKSPGKIKLGNKAVHLFDLDTGDGSEPFDNDAARECVEARRKRGNVPSLVPD